MRLHVCCVSIWKLEFVSESALLPFDWYNWWMVELLVKNSIGLCCISYHFRSVWKLRRCSFHSAFFILRVRTGIEWMCKYTSADFTLKKAVCVHKKAKSLSNVHTFCRLSSKKPAKSCVWGLTIVVCGFDGGYLYIWRGKTLNLRECLFAQNSDIFSRVYNLLLSMEFVYTA